MPDAEIALFEKSGRRAAWARADGFGYVEVTAAPGTYTARVRLGHTVAAGDVSIPSQAGSSVRLPTMAKPLEEYPVVRTLAGVRDLLMFILGYMASSLPPWARVRLRRLAVLRAPLSASRRVVADIGQISRDVPKRAAIAKLLQSAAVSIAPAADAQSLPVFQDTRLWGAAARLANAIGALTEYADTEVRSAPEWRQNVEALRRGEQNELRDLCDELSRATASATRLAYFL